MTAAVQVQAQDPDARVWIKPWQGHKLLVEGTVTANPPVTSVMRELDATCRTILPEQERFNTIEARRGPGPSPAQPPRTPEQIAAAAAARAEREAAEREEAAKLTPPYQPRDYEMLYDFDSELAVFTVGEIQNAPRYAAQIGASKITVSGYRSSLMLSYCKHLEEAPFIARRRAQELVRMTGCAVGHWCASFPEELKGPSLNPGFMLPAHRTR
jgi:hypothetical protein